MFNKKSIAILALTSASAVKITADREPLLTWSAKASKTSYPVDYKVPSYGADPDVTATFGSISTAEKQYNRKWNA